VTAPQHTTEHPHIDETKRSLEDLNNDYLRMDRLYNAFAKRHGETYLSLVALEVLYDHPDGISQKQIAQEIFASKQTVNSMMGDFARRGLVEQHASSVDRRSKLVLLTPEGRAYADHVVGALRAIDFHIAREIGTDDLQRVHAIATRYADAFERMIGEEAGGNRQ
jgi:DNA-binding MarR family transcriptional regulator